MPDRNYLRPINLDRPDALAVLAAMDLLDESGVPQTTANIQMALEEMHKAWREWVQHVNEVTTEKRDMRPYELLSFAAPEDAATEATFSDHAHDGA